MAKKKTGKGRNVDRHKQPRVVFHLPQEMSDALDEYIESLEPRPNASEVHRLALAQFLQRVGYWPRS
jgi:Arc/MetJ-type ribon-helix-helix transcriptional regulator